MKLLVLVFFIGFNISFKVYPSPPKYEQDPIETLEGLCKEIEHKLSLLSRHEDEASGSYLLLRLSSWLDHAMQILNACCPDGDHKDQYITKLHGYYQEMQPYFLSISS